MKSFFPIISNRSTTPLTRKTFDKNFKPSAGPPGKSSRNISLGPLSTRNTRPESSDYFTPKTLSEEFQSVQIDKISFISRINNSFCKPKNFQQNSFKLPLFTNYTQVVNALFSMHSCERSRLQATQLISLFSGLGYCENTEQLVDIFQGITEGLSIETISFSQSELIKLCEDSKTEVLLRVLLKDSFTFGFYKEGKVESLVKTVKKWWSRLDKAQSGFVAFEEIIALFTDFGVIDKAAEVKRLFLKMGQSAGLKQFFSVFAKSMLKFMLQDLGRVISEGKGQGLSPDLLIMALRRKVMIESLSSEGRSINIP